MNRNFFSVVADACIQSKYSNVLHGCQGFEPADNNVAGETPPENTEKRTGRTAALELEHIALQDTFGGVIPEEEG